MRFIFFQLSLYISFLCLGQATLQESELSQLYEKGVNQYRSRLFLQSKHSLQKYIQLDGQASRDASYYLASIQLHQFDNETDLREIVREEKTTPLAGRASRELGDFYFDKGDFRSAAGYYDKIPVISLHNKELSLVRYRLAYSLLQSDYFDSAAQIFDEVRHYGEKEKFKALYYSGFLAFQNGNTQKAIQNLLAAEEDPDLVNNTAPLVARIYAMSSDYDSLITYTSDRIERVGRPQEIQLLLFQGEAYFEIEDYANASKSLRRSLDLGNEKRKPEFYYKLGYSYDQINEPEKAIENYKVAGLDNSEIGQFSAFRLGELYINTKQYTLAVNAFESAIVDGLDAGISEQALFLKGKVMLKAERYNDAIFPLSSFLKKYPESRWYNEASDLLITAYYNTSDYDAAIEYLETSGINSQTARKTYQLVTFHKGQQYFNDGQSASAVEMLKKSLGFNENASITRQASLIMADSYAISGDFESSKAHYGSVIRNSATDDLTVSAEYGLGYASYNTGDFQNAIRHFQLAEQMVTDEYENYHDIKIRIGDCHYIQKNYEEATESYSAALVGSQADYAYYQLGLVSYLQNRVPESADYFEKVINDHPRSEFRDNAMFQLAKMKFENLEFDESKLLNSRLISLYPSNALVPHSLLQRALCNTNLSLYQDAEADLRRLLERYPGHITTNNALLGLQDLIQRGHSVDGFEELMAKVRELNPENESLAIIEFEHAKSKYFSQLYDEAISAFLKLLDYGELAIDVDIKYYLADSYLRSNQQEEALKWLDELVQINDHPYLPRVLDKRGSVLFDLAQYERSAQNYHQLKNLDDNKRNQYKARRGLMLSKYMLSAYDSALYYARQILASDWKPINAEEEAWLISGKCLVEEGDFIQASDNLIQVINSVKDEMAAESYFHLAKIQFTQQQYRASIETLFTMIGEFGSYKKWTDEAYLLLSENYLGLEELLQAKATLKSIIDRSENEELINRAKVQLEQVDLKEAELLTTGSTEDTIKTDSIR